jgi:hypothetical protein
LTLNGVSPLDSGRYSVLIGNVAGTTTSTEATLNVVDTKPPVVTLLGSADVTVECHGTYTEAGANATDSCAGSLFVMVSGNLNLNTPGNYVLVYSATDPSGNTGSASRAIHVVDTTSPVISCSGNIAVCTSSNTARVTFTTTATDTCAGPLTPTCTPASGSSFALGATTVNCSVSDGNGNSSSCSFTVTVTHANVPTITNMLYTGGHFSFKFQSQSSCSYIVEYKNNIDDTSWTTLITVAGDGTQKTVTDNSPAAGNRFYRLRVP